MADFVCVPTLKNNVIKDKIIKVKEGYTIEPLSGPFIKRDKCVFLSVFLYYLSID